MPLQNNNNLTLPREITLTVVGYEATDEGCLVKFNIAYKNSSFCRKALVPACECAGKPCDHVVNAAYLMLKDSIDLKIQEMSRNDSPVGKIFVPEEDDETLDQ